MATPPPRLLAALTLLPAVAVWPSRATGAAEEPCAAPFQSDGEQAQRPLNPFSFLYAPEEFRIRMRDRIRALVDPIDPSIEPDIEERERELLDRLQERGPGAIRPFAIRGYGVSSLTESLPPAGEHAPTLEQWKAAGYLSEDGGNFYIYYPELWLETSAEEILARFYFSMTAVCKYSQRGRHPIILIAALDPGFLIPASGGNDGLTRDFPSDLTIDGIGFLFRNLDVGAITRPGTRRRRNHRGLIAQAVPELQVLARIGERGIPESLLHPVWRRRWDIPDDHWLAYTRWAYLHLLRSILE